MGLTRVRASNILDSDYKQSCRLSTNSDVTLSGGAPSTVDGVSVNLNDRILVKSQSTATQNGIYKVTTVGTGSNGTWTRDVDATAAYSISPGMTVYVEEGLTFADSYWYVSTIGNIVIGTTSITFNSLSNAITTGSNASVIFSNSTSGISGATYLQYNYVSGNLVSNSTTTSTSTNTGALVVGGGVGIGGNLYVGGNLSISGNTTFINAQTITTTDTFAAPIINAGTIGNTGATLTGTISTAAQTNITSVGTLTGLTVSGNVALNNYANIYIPTGSAAQLSALSIVGNIYGQGGAGYLDFLKLTNTFNGGTNPNKYFRVDSAGSIQIINSTYTTNIFNLTDSGDLTIPGKLTMGTGVFWSNGAAYSSGGGSGTPGGSNTQVQFNDAGSFAGSAFLQYNKTSGNLVSSSTTAATSTTTGAIVVAGGIGVGGNVKADIVHASNNGNGTNFQIGDDLWLGDINAANTARVMGQQDNTQGYLVFGSSNTTNYIGRSGSNPLTVTGAFNVTGTLTGVGQIVGYFNGAIGANTANTGAFSTVTTTGNLYSAGNIIAASGTLSTTPTTGALVVSGLGGMGIGGNLNAAGYLTANGWYSESISTPGVFIGNAGTLPYSPRVGFFNGNNSANWQIDNYNGSFRWFTPGTTRMTLDYFGNLQMPGAVSISNAAVSTSTTTGALTISGGVGIGGNINVSNYATFGSGQGGVLFRPIVGGTALALYNTNIIPSQTNYSWLIDGAAVTINGTSSIYTAINNNIITTANSATFSVGTTTAATSTVTGALQVSGGIGAIGNIYAGAIQNTPIGNGTPSTGNFTSVTITGSGGNITGTNTGYIISGYLVANNNLYANSYLWYNNNNSLASTITGTYSNSNVASYLPTYSGSLGGTLTTAAQTNITSVGTLTGLTLSGAINGQTINGTSILGTTIGNTASAINGNLVTASAVYAGTIGNTGTTLTGTLSTAAQTNITSVGTLTALNSSGNIAGTNFNGSGSVTINTFIANGGTTTTALGTGAIVVTGSGGASIGGNLYVGGNLSIAGNTTFINTNVITTTDTFAAPIINAGTIGNTGATLTGTLSTAAQTNITSVGQLTGLTLSGNLNTSASANIVGNIGSGNFVANSGVYSPQYYWANGTIFSSGSSGGLKFSTGNTSPVAPNLGDTWYQGNTDIFYSYIKDANNNSVWFDLSTNPSSFGNLTVNNTATVGNVITTGGIFYSNGSPFTSSKFTAANVAPSSPGLGDTWYQGNTDILFMRVNDTSSSFWMDITSSPNTFGNLGATTATINTLNTGTISATGSIAPTANTSYNLGSTVNYWNNIYGTTFVGTSTTAKYADLAEKYIADALYEPGTVLDFGGEAEVTVSSTVGSTRIAGIVSSNPAYLMNDGLESEHSVSLALVGRVPCKVIGPVNKGDMMISAGNGMAKAFIPNMWKSQPNMGSVIGKALENISDNQIHIIEVVVGRL
jgi:hypothetical protein